MSRVYQVRTTAFTFGTPETTNPFHLNVFRVNFTDFWWILAPLPSFLYALSIERRCSVWANVRLEIIAFLPRGTPTFLYYFFMFLFISGAKANVLNLKSDGSFDIAASRSTSHDDQILYFMPNFLEKRTKLNLILLWSEVLCSISVIIPMYTIFHAEQCLNFDPRKRTSHENKAMV